MTGGDFIVERLPIRCEADEFRSGRKLFGRRFLDFASLRSARNDRDGMGAMVFHDGRKLLANGFLSGMGAM